MITEPDDPDYRYPQPGERFWHSRKDAWCTVRSGADEPYDLRVVGEVAVTFDDGRRATVKLYNLDHKIQSDDAHQGGVMEPVPYTAWLDDEDNLWIATSHVEPPEGARPVITPRYPREPEDS